VVGLGELVCFYMLSMGAVAAAGRGDHRAWRVAGAVVFAGGEVHGDSGMAGA